MHQQQLARSNNNNAQSLKGVNKDPHEVGDADHKVSILAPAGAAMLGLSIGDSIEWPMKGRKPIHLKVVSVTRGA